MRKKVLLLVNSAAGTGSSRSNTYRIVELLTCSGFEVTVYPILPKTGLTSENILAECEGRFDLVVCCGGDGTLNHTVTGLLSLHEPLPLGYLPSGSTNDFASTLGVSRDLEEGCQAIIDGVPFAYDVGRFNKKYFNYVAAFGAFTAVSYSTSQDVKNLLGHAAYGLKSLLSLSENFNCRCRMKVEHDGMVEEDEYLYGAVTNTTSVGGFTAPFADKVKLNDGLFEVLLIKAPSNLGDVEQIITTLASGASSPYVRLFQTGSIRFTSYQGTAWTLDGEFGGLPEVAEISVLPKAVQILLPQGQPHTDEGV